MAVSCGSHPATPETVKTRRVGSTCWQPGFLKDAVAAYQSHHGAPTSEPIEVTLIMSGSNPCSASAPMMPIWDQP